MVLRTVGCDGVMWDDVDGEWTASGPYSKNLGVGG